MILYPGTVCGCLSSQKVAIKNKTKTTNSVQNEKEDMFDNLIKAGALGVRVVT